MTRPSPYEPRPRLLRHPVERSAERLVLWPRRTMVLLSLALACLGFAVWATARHGNATGLVVGIVFLLGGVFFLLNNRPVLVVDRDGIRAPMSHLRTATLPWEEIAVLRAGASMFTGALDVFVWADHEQRTVEQRLHVLSAPLPVRVKKLIPEIESYRPGGHPHTAAPDDRGRT